MAPAIQLSGEAAASIDRINKAASALTWGVLAALFVPIAFL